MERPLLISSLHSQPLCLNSTVDSTRVLRINLPAITETFRALPACHHVQTGQRKRKEKMSANYINDTEVQLRPALRSAVHHCILQKDRITRKRIKPFFLSDLGLDAAASDIFYITSMFRASPWQRIPPT